MYINHSSFAVVRGFDRYWKCFDRWIFLVISAGSGFAHRYVVVLDAKFVGIEDRSPGGQVELPAMPGTRQNPILVLDHVLAALTRRDQSPLQTQAKRCPFVGTPVSNCEILFANSKHSNAATGDFDNPALAGR